MEVQPIRDPMQISAVRALLRAGRRHGHRDELLFVLGINTAFRISDLLSLTIGDVWENGKPKGELRLKERKTAKPRACPLNNAVTTLVERYISELQPQNLGDPLFPSQKGGRLSRKRAFWILRDAGLKVGLKDIGTHSLRKTFGYHAYKKTGGNIALVQRLLNHDNPGDTLRYVGITKDEMDEVFISLNLGLDQGGQ